ncbi:MAG TPA: hypothetical protein PKE54_13590 [Candidatus Obscuribacter sp.]|nr:hypothetical protein [Candidatus Obscuribacter sp.]
METNKLKVYFCTHKLNQALKLNLNQKLRLSTILPQDSVPGVSLSRRTASKQKWQASAMTIRSLLLWSLFMYLTRHRYNPTIGALRR